MCGRYTLFAKLEQIVHRFKAVEIAASLPPSFNIAPSQMVDVIYIRNGVRVLDVFHWGLIPSWAATPKPMINARAETLAVKPTFRQAFLSRRCLIPASGFYEWQENRKSRQPMFVHVPDHELFAFAGIWEEWRNPDGIIVRTCAIITTESNEHYQNVHERMPVILRPEDEAAWLDQKNKDVAKLQQLLQANPIAVSYHAVSTLMNSPSFNTVECIQRYIPAPEVVEQPTLF